MYDKTREEVLLEKLKNGSEVAFKELFDTYYTVLCIYSVQITESKTQSEDIVQGLFVKMWDKKLFLGIKNLKVYLFYSVRNLSIACAKRNNLYLDIQDLEEDVYSPIDDSYDEEELQMKREKLQASLAKLSPQEYKVLLAIILHGKKYKEVADDLDISINTVKTHLNRALKILRKDKDLFIFIMIG